MTTKLPRHKLTTKQIQSEIAAMHAIRATVKNKRRRRPGANGKFVSSLAFAVVVTGVLFWALNR
jgi:hypothetical protein